MSQIKLQVKDKERANTLRKEMTKQRCADVLKKQQEKEKAKTQAKEYRDKTDNANRPKPHKPKGKASHPDQIKDHKRAEGWLEHMMIIVH